MKFLVLLAGCGLGDGSCIEEAVLTYTALDKYGCDYTPAAADMLVPSMDHITEQPGEKRSVLTESARMGRGRIRNLHDISPDDYAALLIPGGIGLGVTKNMDDALGPLEEVRRSMVGLFDGTLSGVTLGTPQLPWSPQGAGGGMTTVNIHITGDWMVRSDEERERIIDELYERISDETRRR